MSMFRCFKCTSHRAASQPSALVSPHERHEKWLQLTTEDAIETELPIIDAHHHLYRNSLKEILPFQPQYLLDDFSRDLNGGHNIQHTVFKECHAFFTDEGPEELWPVAEVAHVDQIARVAVKQKRKGGVCSGIIGHVDLSQGAKVEEVLLAEIAAAPGRLRGVRDLAMREHSFNFRNPKFLEGVAVVDRLGLALCASGPEARTPEQLPLDFKGCLGGVADLARRFPKLTLIVEHCGGAVGPKAFAVPGKQREWELALENLACCSNVVITVGGLQMDINGFKLGEQYRSSPIGSEELAALTLPIYGHVIRVFGPERCMFESNYPVDKWGVSYGVLWNAFKRIAQSLDLTKAEKAAIFHDTAARALKLDCASGHRLSLGGA